jgi:hypothetical protein
MAGLLYMLLLILISLWLFISCWLKVQMSIRRLGMPCNLFSWPSILILLMFLLGLFIGFRLRNRLIRRILSIISLISLVINLDFKMFRFWKIELIWSSNRILIYSIFRNIGINLFQENINFICILSKW